MKTRNNSIDTWKGIAIVAVIATHACNGCIGFDFDDVNHWTGQLFRALVNFAVPLFFAISGYFAPDHEKLQAQGTWHYYTHRLIPLWIPYLIWTFITIPIIDPSQFLRPTAILRCIFMGTGIGIGYFVIVLTSLTLIHPLLAPRKSGWLLTLGATLSLISLAVFYWLRISPPDHLHYGFHSSFLPFTTWIVFFYLGFHIKSAKPGKPDKKLLLTLIAGAFLLSALEGLIIYHRFGSFSFAVSQLKLSTYLYSFLICILALQFDAGILNDWRVLSWLGRHSLVLYLCHMLFLSQVSKVLDPFLHEFQVLDIVLSTVLTTLTASLAVLVAERILPRPVSGYLLGVR